MFHWHASGCPRSSYSCLPGASLPARSSSQARCSKKCAPLDCHPHQYPVTQTAAEVSGVKTAHGSAICRWNLFQPETDFLQIRIRELLLKPIVPAMTFLLSPHFLQVKKQTIYSFSSLQRGLGTKVLIRLHRCCCSLSFPTPDNSTTMAGEENLHAPPLLPSPHYSNTAPPQIPARPPLVPAACVKALTLPCCSARAAMAMHRTRVLLTSYRAGCFLMYKCKHTNASRPRNWLMELSFLCHNLAANDSLVLYA